MTEHTKTDGLPGIGDPALPQVLERSRPRNDRMSAAKVECNACPVLCQISEGRSGACDRYANQGGVLVRVDPVVLLRKTLQGGEPLVVPFAGRTPRTTYKLTASGRTAFEQYLAHMEALIRAMKTS